ncbi:MAG: sensor histidine kinase [Saprospiraceae bacterium]|nr:sensor histidine kinase [Saprospiraceae bacterium]
MKNYSSREMAVYIAAITFLVTFFCTLFLILIFNINVNWVWFILFHFVLLLICLFVSYFYIEYFIYRRVKLIYKIINRTKLNSIEKNNPQNDSISLEQAAMDVEDWSKNRDNEIESLRVLANYRRNYLGNISHELKTPLFNIQGFVETLLDGAYLDATTNLHYLKRTASNIERLVTIIDDLESIQYYEATDLILEKQPFNIVSLIEECIEVAEPSANQKRIKILFKDDAKQPYITFADREAIRQVLNNLLINSIKYGKENGKTKVGIYDLGDSILVEITDNGIGIEAKHLPHLFDRFYRVDKSRSRDQGGSGLGLSIVKHIVEAHRQTVNVRSTPNVGTTFGFTLPKYGNRD